MFLTPDKYFTSHSYTLWNDPPYLGPTPVFIGLNVQQSDKAKVNHPYQLKEWEMYNEINNTLQNMVINTFENSCLTRVK